MTHHLATTFDEMVDVLAIEDPVALFLGWWCRIEKALGYYTVAYHDTRMRTAAEAINVLRSDARVDLAVVHRLHELRRTRNAVAHGEVLSVSADDAKAFASEALTLVWIIGCAVPDELASSSDAGVV